MSQPVFVAIPVSQEAASMLGNDPRKLEAAGRLLSAAFLASASDDPLLAVMNAIGRKAQEAGLSEADVDAELAALKAERREQG